MNYILEEIYLCFLIFTRLSVFLITIPVFSGKNLPIVVRLGLGLVITYIIYPFIPYELAVPSSFVQVMISVFNEILVGFMMGFAVQMIFFAIEVAGHILSTEAGLSMSADVNPLTDTNASNIGNLLFYFGVLVFFIAKVHHEIIYAFFKSFEVVKPGNGFLDGYQNHILIEQTANVFVLGVRMAAPVIAINFITNIIFAFLGKIVPKMNVFMISFAVRIVVGLVIIIGSLELITYFIFTEIKARPGLMLEFLIP